LIRSNFNAYLFITENPCVPGSIPGGTTKRKLPTVTFFFLFQYG